MTTSRLPTASDDRKRVPMARGLLDYFPDALAAVAELSAKATDQHHPDKPMHWDRDKSNDNADCIMRHLVDRGTLDSDGISHTVKVAWRALALLQLELEEQLGLPLPRGARKKSEKTIKASFGPPRKDHCDWCANDPCREGMTCRKPLHLQEVLPSTVNPDAELFHQQWVKTDAMHSPCGKSGIVICLDPKCCRFHHA